MKTPGRQDHLSRGSSARLSRLSLLLGTSSEHASSSRAFLVLLGLLAAGFAGSFYWYQAARLEPAPPPMQEPAARLCEKNSTTGGTEQGSSREAAPSSAQRQADPTDRAEEADKPGFRGSLGEALRIERVHPSADPEREQRALARRDFLELSRVIHDLRSAGLTGEALFDAARAQLGESPDPQTLRLLDSLQSLDEQLALTNPGAMSPEEQFEALRSARRNAFGQEMADLLFGEEEAYQEYKLKEKAILADPGRTPEEQQGEITALRNALQVELAKKGTYLSFADDRKGELESRLRERVGDRFDEMTAEDRKTAMWEMYREELPPEIMEKAEEIASRKAQRAAEIEAYLQEQEAILNDPDLTFEQRQARLVELSERLRASRPGSAP
ncbi:MAG: lipase secretion chaperone [bacterium]